MSQSIGGSIAVEKIRLLGENQLEHLSADQVRGLDAVQSARLPIERIRFLNIDQMNHLTRDQVRGLDEIQVRRLPAGRAIQLLENLQIHYLERREQIEHVLPGQVAFLAIKQMKYLKGREQVERISVIKIAIILNNSQFKDMNRFQQSTFLVSRLLAFLVLTKIALTVRNYIVNCKRRVDILELKPLDLSDKVFQMIPTLQHQPQEA